MSILTIRRIVGVDFSVRCCLSVNLMIVGIGGVSFVVRCCLSVKINEWRDFGYLFWCKMLFECQIRQMEGLGMLILL